MLLPYDPGTFTIPAYRVGVMGWAIAPDTIETSTVPDRAYSRQNRSLHYRDSQRSI
jgi:hypothetical protein